MKMISLTMKVWVAFVSPREFRSNLSTHLPGVFFEAIPETDLADALEASGKVSEKDIPEIVKFFEKCLMLDPADRSLDAVYGVRWMREGAACSCGYCGY